MNKAHLPDPSLEKQIIIALQTNASFEEAFKSIALSVEAIDNLGTWTEKYVYSDNCSKRGTTGKRTRFDKRGFEHVREKRENRVQRCEIFPLADLAVFDTSQELGKDGQI